MNLLSLILVTSSGFLILSDIMFPQEFQVSEQPTLMTLVDSSLAGVAGSAADNTICVGYRGQFDLLNECTGELSHLFTVHDSTKSHLVAAIDLYEDEEPELLLCYNSKGF